MFDRQFEVFNSKARAQLVCGPRLSGKTWAVLHRIARHLWETPDAQVAMFARTLKAAKDEGTWSKIHRITLKEWIASGVGMKYTTKMANGTPGWKVDANTRTPYCRVTNMYGGESQLKLFSLDNDNDIEDKIKEQAFSMIYFSELSAFGDRKVLVVSLPQLRMENLRYDQHMWIADTNPADDGDASWIYQVFYREKNQSYEQYLAERKGQRVMTEKVWKTFYGNLSLIEIRPEENQFLDPQQLDELKVSCAYDEGLYARYVEGKWVYGDGDASRHFRGKFNQKLHVLGDISDTDESKHQTLVPSEHCIELPTGWDLGEGTNHAVAFIEKRMVGNLPYFYMLDEVVSVKEEVSIQDIVAEAVEKLTALEKVAGHPLGTERCWSDRSSLERYNALADTYQHLEVLAWSNGRFELKGTPKGEGSVRARVRLLQRLLFQNRFLISAHCIHTIEMLKHLKKGKNEFVMEKDPHKHIFDAITYLILMECAEELENYDRDPAIGERRSRIEFSIPLT